MSEQGHNHEAKTHAPSPEAEHKVESQTVSEKTDAEHESDRQETLEQSRQEIEQHAAKSESIKFETPAEPVSQAAASRELKDMAYQRTLVRIRKQLGAPSRALSKVIHQPVVDALSQVGEKTIARPSGLLAGATVAFIGSSTLLYFAKHYGFHYNFLAFALLFAGGFALGLVLELGFRLLTRKHR